MTAHSHTPDDDDRQDEERDSAPRRPAISIDGPLAAELEQLRALMGEADRVYVELTKRVGVFQEAMMRFIDGGVDAKAKAERITLVSEAVGNVWVVLVALIGPSLQAVTESSEARQPGARP